MIVNTEQKKTTEESHLKTILIQQTLFHCYGKLFLAISDL